MARIAAAGSSRRSVFFISLALAAPMTGFVNVETPAPPSQVRRPVAMAIVDDGATLLVANRRSGTISEVDARAEKVVVEHSIGRGLSDLAAIGDGRRLLAVDPEEGELLLLDHHDRSVSVVARVSVGPDPIRVAVLPGGKTAVVTSRWPKRITVVEISEDKPPSLRVSRTVDLPFRPRDLVALPDRPSVIVADAFGGKVAVVDPIEGKILSVHEIPSHNLRGLALSRDGLTVLIAHQTSSRLATSGFDDIHWGALIKNQLRTLRIDALADPGSDPLRGSTVKDLDDVGHAAGDPEDVAIDPRGRPVIALAGVGEVSFLAHRSAPAFRVPVGTRPSCVAIGPDGKSAFVADAEDDAVAIVPLAGGSPRVLSLGPKPEPSAEDRGERLFASARLSHHGWMSCRSCHADGHTSGRLADTLGDGSYGAPKLVPSLLGVGSTGPWGWLGNFDALEDQVRSSVETTMRGPSPTKEQVDDITAYLRSLAPLPSTAEDAASARGREVFKARKCASCHAGPAFTTDGVSDVGLSDEVGHRAFNPPSLRGVRHRDRFLHDGRAGSLEGVFRDHGHPPGGAIPAGELADLIAYLRTL